MSIATAHLTSFRKGQTVERVELESVSPAIVFVVGANYRSRQSSQFNPEIRSTFHDHGKFVVETIERVLQRVIVY